MKFVVRVQSGMFPYPELGPPGSELSGYIPTGTVWRQIGHGQGDGMVEIAGCEWGFYQGADGELQVRLFAGRCTAKQAFEFVTGVADLTCREKAFEIYVEGTWLD